MAIKGAINDARTSREKLIRSVAEYVADHQTQLRRKGHLTEATKGSFTKAVHAVLLDQYGLDITHGTIIGRYQPSIGPSFRRFMADGKKAMVPLRKKNGSVAVEKSATRSGKAESGEILTGVRHAVQGQTRLRAKALLAAAKAVAKENPEGFSTETQFAQAVADAAHSRFSLGIPMRGSAIHASKSYWPVIKKYCRINKCQRPKPTRARTHALPNARETLLKLKPLSFKFPHAPCSQLLVSAFRGSGVLPSEITRRIEMMIADRGKDTEELRALIERHAKSRSSISWKQLVDLRAELSSVCRGIISVSQTQSIVGHLRGGADEIQFLIDVVRAGYRWSTHSAIYHGTNRDYLVLYKLASIKGGDEFYVLYADTRIDYSTVCPKIPKESVRRREIMEIAGAGGETLPPARFVVFAGEDWDGRKPVGAETDARDVVKGHSNIAKIEAAIQRARQAAGKLPEGVFTSMHIGNDLRTLEITLHLARAATGARRDDYIRKGISAAEGLIARLLSRTAGGGGGTGGVRRFVPSASLSFLGDNLCLDSAGAAICANLPVTPYISAMSAFQFAVGKLF